MDPVVNSEEMRVIDPRNLHNEKTSQTFIQNRIEPTDDPVINDKLFSLYERLIEPVSYIEKSEKLKEGLCQEVQYRKGVHLLPKNKISILIQFLLVTVIGIMLLVVYLRYADKNFYAVPDYYSGEEIKTFYLENSPFFVRPVVHISFSNMPIILKILAIVLLCIYPTIIILVIATIIYNIVLHRPIPELESEINDVSNQEMEVLSKIAQYIVYVPPLYRTSDALGYFVESYKNTRVSNLQQAVNAYDNHRRHGEIMAALRQIEFRQILIQDQLEQIREDIWDANFWF